MNVHNQNNDQVINELKKKYTEYKESSHNFKKYKVIVNTNLLSNTLKINENILKTIFKDARTSSKICENWASMIYNFILSENSNDKIDGMLNLSDITNLPSLTLGIRCLTKSGVDFVQSQYKGRGKIWHWRPEFVVLAVGITNFQIICDINDFPYIYFTTIRSTDIIHYTYCYEIKNFTRNNYYKIFFNKTLEEMISENLFEEVRL